MENNQIKQLCNEVCFYENTFSVSWNLMQLFLVIFSLFFEIFNTMCFAYITAVSTLSTLTSLSTLSLLFIFLFFIIRSKLYYSIDFQEWDLPQKVVNH